MIARYTDHAANERTFLAWIRTGLAVAAFGLFLVKLNVLFDAIGGGSPPHPLAEHAGVFAAVPCGVAAFGGTRDRRGDFLHLSRGALTFSAHDCGPNPDRRSPWI